MKKTRTISVDGTPITICQRNDEDCISLTDIVRNMPNSNSMIGNWMKTKDTIEYLGLWESLYNPDFKLIEFDELRKESGTNRFTLSPQQWVQKTNAIGIYSQAGRYGGTYAHKDIAFEFAAWISPQVKLYLIKEFQRLKHIEAKDEIWDYRRMIAATNYRIQTDAIKSHLIPWSSDNQKPDALIYANEAELINYALFGLTSKQWREKFPEENNVCKTIRDCADTNRLIVLSNLESINAMLIADKIPTDQRLEKLQQIAITQLESLEKLDKEFPQIESPNRNKLLTDKNNGISMTFGEALKKISKAGKPKNDK